MLKIGCINIIMLIIKWFCKNNFMEKSLPVAPSKSKNVFWWLSIKTYNKTGRSIVMRTLLFESFYTKWIVERTKNDFMDKLELVSNDQIGHKICSIISDLSDSIINWKWKIWCRPYIDSQVLWCHDQKLKHKTAHTKWTTQNTKILYGVG